MSEENYLFYKGLPVFRNGRTIYYGNSYDPCIVMLQVLNTRKIKDIDAADRVIIQLFSNDQSLSPAERMIKKSEKKGLCQALELANIWLDNEKAKTN